MHTVRDADRMEKEMRDEAWNLEGWLSVGSHKLVQQTLRVLVRGCEHPYAVRESVFHSSCFIVQSVCFNIFPRRLFP